MCALSRFKLEYEGPILCGNEKSATDREKHIGSTVAKVIISSISAVFEDCYFALQDKENRMAIIFVGTMPHRCCRHECITLKV